MSYLSLILSVDSDDCKQWQLMKNEERFKHLNEMYEITRFTEFKKDFIAHIKWMKEKINIYKFCKFWSKLDEQYNVQYQFFTAQMLYIHISSKFQFFVYNKYNPSLFLRLIDIKATFTILLDLLKQIHLIIHHIVESIYIIESLNLFSRKQQPKKRAFLQ